MTIGQSMLPEFDQEMQSTRKVLERVPDEKWNWKPHDKSGTVGWLAGHIATLPGWTTMTIKTEELDYAPVDGPAFSAAEDRESQKDLLAVFDKKSAEARAALAGRQRLGYDEGLDAQGRWPDDFHHATRCLYSRHGDEPPDPSSRAAHRLLSVARRASAGPLRTQRRRKSSFRFRVTAMISRRRRSAPKASNATGAHDAAIGVTARVVALATSRLRYSPASRIMVLPEACHGNSRHSLRRSHARRQISRRALRFFRS